MTDKESGEISNSLTSFYNNLTGFGNIAQLSKTDTQYVNTRRYLISNDRTLLNYIYVEHGIVQTLIDQPVDDAFRGGFEIKTDQLDDTELTKLENYLERHQVVEKIKQAIKWKRLFGGGGFIIATDQKPDTPLEASQINEKSNLDLIPFDLWEMHGGYIDGGAGNTYVEPEYYNYYDERIHHSRVYRMNGKTPPSFIRRRLRGWGMSEIERLVRSLNQYMKNQDVVFELMDEAKIDVYKINKFNSALATKGGTDAITNRVQLANQIKNFQNAIVMDKEDEFDQKSMNFTGLGDMLKQIREGVAADLKMPVTKLFGISSAGFNSGEDDIENYNSMIEAEIRSQIKYVVIDVIGLYCQKLFGVIPDDLMIEFPELRMMSTEQVEIAKTNEYNRVISSYQSGLIDPAAAKQCINRGDLLPIKIEEDDEIFESMLTQDLTVSDGDVQG